MIKLKKIEFEKDLKILCQFTNGEKKLLNLDVLISKSDKYFNQIIKNQNFKNAKIGDFGEIYWDKSAQIVDTNGTPVLCNYDISPEFVYHKSIQID